MHRTCWIVKKYTYSKRETLISSFSLSLQQTISIQLFSILQLSILSIKARCKKATNIYIWILKDFFIHFSLSLSLTLSFYRHIFARSTNSNTLGFFTSLNKRLSEKRNKKKKFSYIFLTNIYIYMRVCVCQSFIIYIVDIPGFAFQAMLILKKKRKNLSTIKQTSE